ncbi:MAG TPA: protein-disulfide reductase DsbD domain-containing protein [Planctomycetota bacterium]|nr:protein-disulfide reductase DsbD domain-containing protein [Planctomycetota bacterium]
MTGRLAAEPAAVAPGSSFALRLTLDIEKGWHLYGASFTGIGEKTVVEAELPAGFTAGTIEFPPTHEIESFGEKIDVFEGRVEIVVPVDVAPAVEPKSYSLEVRAKYQACDASTCVGGETAVAAVVKVDRSAPATLRLAPTKPPANATPALEGRIDKAPRSYPVQPRLELARGKLAAGDETTVTVHLAIDDGFHIYAPASDPEAGRPLELEAKGFELVGAPQGPAPRPYDDPNFGKKTLLYEGNVTLVQRVRRIADVAGERPSVAVTAMACDARSCRPPGTWVASFDLPAVAGGARQTTLKGDVAEAAEQTIGAFLAAAVAGGALSLLTPCVFPMVPITVSFFSKRAGGKKSRTLALATVYALGIVVTFTLVGVAVAVLVGATGLNRLATNVWMNLGLGALFVVLGLSFLGLFQFRAPSGLAQRVEQAKTKTSGDVGFTLLLAIAFTLASFTCTVPVLATLLTLAARSESVARPAVGMLAYSATFAAPFFVLALFPSFLKRLPRGGAWLETIQVSLGFVEIAAALKFLSNADIGADSQILTRPLFLAAWIALFAALALYLFGLLRLPGGEGAVGAIRSLAGVAALGFSLYLATGLVGARFGRFVEGFLPPPGYGGEGIVASAGASSRGEIAWEHDLDAGLVRARAEKRRLFLNFTGFQCTNCRAMEQGMFPKAAVRAELDRYVTVALHEDAKTPPELVARSERYQALQEDLFGHNAIPFYAIVEPDGRTVVATFRGYTQDEAAFVAFLKKG